MKSNLNFFDETDIGCQEKRKNNIPLDQDDLMQLKREEIRIQFIKSYIPWQQKYTYEEFFTYLFKAVNQYGRRWTDKDIDLKIKVDTDYFIDLLKHYMNASYNKKTRILTMDETQKWRVLFPLDVCVKQYRLADCNALIEDYNYDATKADYEPGLDRTLYRIASHFKMLYSWSNNRVETILSLGFSSILDYYYETAKVFNYTDVIKFIDTLRSEIKKHSVKKISEFLSSQNAIHMMETFEGWYYSGTKHDKFNAFLREIAWLKGAKIKATDYTESLYQYADAHKGRGDDYAIKRTFQDMCTGKPPLMIDTTVIDNYYKDHK